MQLTAGAVLGPVERRREAAWVGLLFAVIFLVISTFWMLKPLKTAVFLLCCNQILIVATWIPTALCAGREFKLRATRHEKLRAELKQEAA